MQDWDKTYKIMSEGAESQDPIDKGTVYDKHGDNVEAPVVKKQKDYLDSKLSKTTSDKSVKAETNPDENVKVETPKDITPKHGDNTERKKTKSASVKTPAVLKEETNKSKWEDAYSKL